jgi:hypothetical protein
MPRTFDPAAISSAVADEQKLAREAQAWLPTSDPAGRRDILAILKTVEKGGVDPIAGLRSAIARWFGTEAATAMPPLAHRPRPSATQGLVLERLHSPRHPTLWPQRPKRLTDELFSSWLWRTAVAAGAPPGQFGAEALGTTITDPDRHVSLPTLRRLAQVNGISSTPNVPWLCCKSWS